jgi:hypothetical protein
MVWQGTGWQVEQSKTGTIEKTGGSGKPLVDLNKTNWQQTNREHRYKYIGDNEGRWETPGGGWRHAQRQVKQIRV